MELGSFPGLSQWSASLAQGPLHFLEVPSLLPLRHHTPPALLLTLLGKGDSSK